jgi:hypothetical protein
MDGTFAIGGFARHAPGASFGTAPVAPRALDAGMGLAVARRTVFRPDDRDDWGRVADRVAAGNTALAATAPEERARLRNAIATGALITSGRHLQHGDETQPGRPMEVFTKLRHGDHELRAVLSAAERQRRRPRL